jgi:hypothetical protein
MILRRDDGALLERFALARLLVAFIFRAATAHHWNKLFRIIGLHDDTSARWYRSGDRNSKQLHTKNQRTENCETHCRAPIGWYETREAYQVVLEDQGAKRNSSKKQNNDDRQFGRLAYRVVDRCGPFAALAPSSPAE